MNNDRLQVFPNPIKGMITASGLSGTGVIKIISLDGKNVLTKKVTAQTLSLNLIQLNAGVYILEYSDAKLSYKKKIIKH